MKIANVPSSVTGKKLEDSWRLRLEEIHLRYQEASQQYGTLLQAQPDGGPFNPDGALAVARHAESRALAEYTRTIRVFTELTVKGKIPEERSVGASNRL